MFHGFCTSAVLVPIFGCSWASECSTRPFLGFCALPFLVVGSLCVIPVVKLRFGLPVVPFFGHYSPATQSLKFKPPPTFEKSFLLSQIPRFRRFRSRGGNPVQIVDRRTFRIQILEPSDSDPGGFGFRVEQLRGEGGGQLWVWGGVGPVHGCATGVKMFHSL